MGVFLKRKTKLNEATTLETKEILEYCPCGC